MTEGEQALAIEKIKQAKAKYWFNMDMKRWDDLRMVFTKDAVIDFRGERDLKPGEGIENLPPVEEAIARGETGAARGRDNFIPWYAELLGSWVTIHHGHAPIVELTSATTAKGIFPMFDYISDGTREMKGYGHYHDLFELEDGEWRISYLSLTRLRCDGVHPADFAHEGAKA